MKSAIYSFLLCSTLTGVNSWSAGPNDALVNQVLEEISTRLEDPACTLDTLRASALALQQLLWSQDNPQELSRLLNETQNAAPAHDQQVVTPSAAFSLLSSLRRQASINNDVYELLMDYFFERKYSLSGEGAGVGFGLIAGASGVLFSGTLINPLGKSYSFSANGRIISAFAFGPKLLAGSVNGTIYLDAHGKRSVEWGYSDGELVGGSFVFGAMKLQSHSSSGGTLEVIMGTAGSILDYPCEVNLNFTKGRTLYSPRDYQALHARLGLTK
jgi:hypothetical protein